MAFHLILTATLFLVSMASDSCAFTFQGIQRYRRRCGLATASSSESISNNNKEPIIPRPGHRPPPQGGDMAYTRPNIDRQYAQYTQIRNVGGDSCVTDVYASSSKQPTVFWFAGKVARCTGTNNATVDSSSQETITECKSSSHHYNVPSLL